MILIVTAGVAGFLLLDRFVLKAGPETDQSTVVDSNTASIAVMPFSNLSEGPGNEQFGDALAEELLNLLATVDGLKVAARTSSFHFKDKKPTIGEVAELLDVATILEGSVQRSDSRIRVSVRLVGACGTCPVSTQNRLPAR